MGLAQVNIKVKARQKYSKANEGRNVHISKSFLSFLFRPKPRIHPKGPKRAAAAPAAGKKKRENKGRGLSLHRKVRKGRKRRKR